MRANVEESEIYKVGTDLIIHQRRSDSTPIETHTHMPVNYQSM